MNDPMKQAWNDVEEQFATLGRAMKDRYRGAAEGEPDDTDVGDEQDSGAALRLAFERLVAAAREFGDRAGDVARDDDVKAQAKQAAASLNDALSATVNVIGEHVGGLFKRPGKRPTDAPVESAGISSGVATEQDPHTNDPEKEAQPDPDAPGTYVDDDETTEPPEPNEPA